MSIQNYQPLPARRTGPPVHWLSAVVTMGLDWMWAPAEDVAVLSVIGEPVAIAMMIGCAAGAFVAVSLVQRYLDHDEWGPALAKGAVMGIIAGVPFSVTSTAVGVVIASWAGLDGWRNRRLIAAVANSVGYRSAGQAPGSAAPLPVGSTKRRRGDRLLLLAMGIVTLAIIGCVVCLEILNLVH